MNCTVHGKKVVTWTVGGGSEPTVVCETEDDIIKALKETKQSTCVGHNEDGAIDVFLVSGVLKLYEANKKLKEFAKSDYNKPYGYCN